MIKLKLPITPKKLNDLNVGDYVEISGRIFTARDKASRWLSSEKIPEKLSSKIKNSVIYHCGPIMAGKKSFVALSAGPTTSERMFPYLTDLNKKYRVKAVIGKGGFRNTNIFKKNKMVYLHSLSGCGALLAKKIIKVHSVFGLKEFGMPEAIWEIEVKDFPVLVTIDSKGNNLHDKIYAESGKIAKKLENS
ncbi:MAG: FumA C-terminus/TtdB family hydratase beta subunit [archaeon]